MENIIRKKKFIKSSERWKERKSYGLCFLTFERDIAFRGHLLPGYVPFF